MSVVKIMEQVMMLINNVLLVQMDLISMMDVVENAQKDIGKMMLQTHVTNVMIHV